MLTQAFTKKSLFGATAIAGVTALLAVSPSYAQSTAAPTGGDPQSPASGAPPQTAPDPANVQPNSDDENQVDSPQEEAAEDDEGEVEAVVVTGSRIRRSPTNAPAPLIQINREEVLASGEANIVEFLADIPALQTSQVPEDTTGAGLNDGGLSLLNLRNLGSDRTLVLVDGRRHVGSAINSLSVDVDTIPGLLLENVEVVTGGQSALYGADAVSGVVNFIQRRNFDGIELDGALGQINQDGQLNRRISGLVGRNFLNDRLNVYAFAEYAKADEVLDLDVDFRRDARGFIGNDADPSPSDPDGVLDILLTSGLRDAFFARGGVFILSNQVSPSPLSDPDRPFQTCPTTFLVGGGFRVTPTTGVAVGTNCTAVAPENNSTFVFNADGTARPFNFGTRQGQTGINRRANIGGDGLNSGTEFGQGSRRPESEDLRFQGGVNFDITDDIMFFGEAKYVEEETFDAGQPTFFQLSVLPVAAGTRPNQFSSTQFVIGNDNAFLPADLRNRILTNTRPVFEDCPRVRVPGTGAALGTLVCPTSGPANPNFRQQVGTVADPRAGFGLFGPSRNQLNQRELQRYVVGLRGDRDQLGFINNFSWEVGYTYGQVDNTNFERGLDIERFQLAIDSVRDVNNVTGRGANSIVCRVQLLAAQRAVIPDQNPNSPRDVIAPDDPKVTGCIPISVFGSDFRDDANEEDITGGGGRPGLTPEQDAFIFAEVVVTDQNKQEDFLAFASGELLDGFLPAGPIGIALGYEYRKESTSSTGRDRSTGERFLFLNSGQDFDEVSYDTSEFFAEVRIPLLRDLPFADTLEVSGAFRRSEYSIESVGQVDTYSLQGLYRPSRDLLFRATYGEATRIPTLGDLNDPGGQTFANGLGDPCDSLALRNIPNPEIRERQRANCITLLGPAFDPDNTRIIYASGVPGTIAGNPELVPEESRSYTASIALTPRFIPRFSLVLDYYNIKITDAIAFPPIQAILTACVSGTSAGLNQQACDLLVRNGPTPGPGTVPFQLIDFLQGPVNFAAFRTQGLDFTARYAFETEDFFGRNFGRIDYALRGNYLIRNEFFVNINDPNDVTEIDSAAGQARVRFLSTLTYSPIDSFSVSWNWDYQTSQELFDSDFATQDPDNRDVNFLETGSYSTHSFTARYELRDNITLRAGVVNAFDNDPPAFLGSTTSLDNFDLFGRRFSIGANVRFGAAADR